MDDPRYEDVKKIIKEMISDTKKRNYEIIINREEAIKRAIEIADNDDLVLILGKGRDNHMLIGDDKIPYSDIDVLENLKKI